MGVNYFVFGDADSRFYNIEVFFKDVDRTPKRVYEIREIPSRNGAVYIDQNRYEDVPVAYDCVALDDADRKEFVNALASQMGHRRLEDSFNDDEFYNAVFDGDIDPHVTAERDQSTFTVYFTRSPQRFLKSGEDPVEVSDGDTLTNPTLFESSPLLEAEGYGNIEFNGYEIELINGPLGNIQLMQAGQKKYTGSDTRTISGASTFDTSLVEVGDTITISGKRYSSSPEASVYASVNFGFDNNAVWLDDATNTDVNAVASYGQNVGDGQGNSAWTLILYAAPATFTVGTAGTFTASTQWSYSEHLYGSQTVGSVTFSLTVTVEYDGNNKITITMTREIVGDTLNKFSYDSAFTNQYTRLEVNANSSVSILGHPTYIDCDIGEVYKIEGDTIVDLNRFVDLGSKLPTLAAGSNEITYDNTITDLQIVPRWWKI